MRSCRCNHKRAGFTLLEVVVGLVLMASVLVGTLLAYSAHQRQRRLAEARLVAITVADQLLNQLSSSRDGIPGNGGGPINGKPNWFWRTGVIGTTAPANVPLKVIRLEVIEVTADGGGQRLATVDVVEPIS